MAKPLEERVNQIRDEIEALISARAEQIAKECPGVPAGVIRRSIVGDACACNAFLTLSDKGEL